MNPPPRFPPLEGSSEQCHKTHLFDKKRRAKERNVLSEQNAGLLIVIENPKFFYKGFVQLHKTAICIPDKVFMAT